jgi:outer membrane protein assembly factor BamB
MPSEPPQQSFVAPIFLGGDDVLVATLGGGLQRVRLRDGQVVWNLELPIGVAAVPALDSGFVFVAGADATLRKVRLSTGVQEWVKALPLESAGGVRVSGDRVFVTAMDDSVSAFNSSDGRLLWTYRRPSPEGNIRWSLRGQAQPLVNDSGNRVFVGFSDGVFVSLDASSGQTLWERNFSRAGRFQDADLSPVFAWQEKLVLVAIPDGDLLALAASDGSTQWSVSGGGNAVPRVDGDRVWVSQRDGQLWIADVKTGQVSRRLDLADRGDLSAPVKIGARHWALTSSRKSVLIINEESGRIIWEQDLGRGTLAPAASDGQRLLVLTSRNQLLVYRVQERQGS